MSLTITSHDDGWPMIPLMAERTSEEVWYKDALVCGITYVVPSSTGASLGSKRQTVFSTPHSSSGIGLTTVADKSEELSSCNLFQRCMESAVRHRLVGGGLETVMIALFNGLFNVVF